MSETKKEKKARRLSVEHQPQSGLSSFIERPVPTDKEVDGFERVVAREIREQEIDSHLSEIYRDPNGRLIDVKKMAVRRRHFWSRLLRKLVWLAILAAIGYGAYNYFFGASNDISALELKITAPDSVIVSQPVAYQITYHNPTKFLMSHLVLEIQYPAGFIFSDASVAPAAGNYNWSLPDLAPGENGNLTINGQLIALPDSANVVLARLSYLPGAFSTQFTKEDSASTLVSGPGFTVNLQANDTAFLGQSNNLTLMFSDVQPNFVGDFNLGFDLPAEATAGVASTTAASPSTPIATTTPFLGTLLATSTMPTAPTSTNISVAKVGGQNWLITGLTPGMSVQTIPLLYQINQKTASSTVTVRLFKQLPNGQSYIFWKKTLTPEVVNSDLNLTLALNGSPDNSALNFGQTLNYSLSYDNKGSNIYKDVVIMASLSGAFLDWGSVKTDSGGLTNNQTLLWTKQDVPALSQISPGQSGQINFTINLKDFKASDLGKSLNIISYAQYSVNNQSVSGSNNKSNTINSLINSDLSLNEQIRYFDENNTPVGSGPLPPQVGQTTSVRVFWTVKNNLHELAGTSVTMTLPPYVAYNNNASTNVGSVTYDAASRQVTWYIGRLPVSVYSVGAYFNISLTPAAADKNKILVLSPGSIVSAQDTETKAMIIKKVDPKTTKLEDDDIAGLNNSGIVQ